MTTYINSDRNTYIHNQEQALMRNSSTCLDVQNSKKTTFIYSSRHYYGRKQKRHTGLISNLLIYLSEHSIYSFEKQILLLLKFNF